MKNWLLTVLLLALVPTGCREDVAVKPSVIRFTLNPRASDSQGRQATSLPEGASLYVSIRHAGGEEVYNLEPVRLLKLGDEYISEPLVLPGGDYELTDFLVADSDGNVVFATPREGAEMADWVDDPLPQAFTVSVDAIARVDVQVLPTDLYQPGQFGYVTFTVEVVHVPYFKLSVFRAGSTRPEFARVQAYLVSEGDTLLQRYLPASVNDIAFDGNMASTYTLVLIKESYKTYTRTFVLADFLAELNGAPLQVTLEDALTFTAFFDSPYFQFQMSASGATTQPFIVNWGDGAEEAITPNSDNISYTPQHTYARPGRYHVSLVGDLAAVDRLSFIYTSVDNFALRALPALRSFGISNVNEADSVDLSHNPALESLNLSYSDIQYFDISHNPLIRELVLEGSVDIPIPVLNQMIQNLHDHAFEQQIYQGELNLMVDRRGGLLGPPSPEAMDLLGHMGELGWIIYQ
ncbi:PKD domain-containing protein [Parachryseolinea silvisoli]|uniref:PKD domain-containing protein n=1 Tax=Parachryseolinea silvisoli TaxID=2873601 RepID=UPI002265D4E6|nr:PKD domain-containing protein [Parachryseolinea silvisoli]MCD9019724.1 PKD domain-containing protein [Parachryseolinea silvisoli]